MTIESVNFIQGWLESLDYGTITLLMTIESSFLPFPSEIVVPPAAYDAAATGRLNVYLIVLFATIGATLGALINYSLAYWLGRPIVYKFVNSRLGHLCLLNSEKMEQAEKFFDKHGAISTFVGRLLPAVRQLISIPAGLVKMSMPKFLIFTILGAFIWNVILAALGYYLQSILPKDQLISKVTEYSHLFGYSLAVIVAIILMHFIYKKIKK